MDRAAPEPGLSLGRYVLVRRIGRGGSGEVWQAILHGPEGFRKDVAIKLLKWESLAPERHRALIAEARLAAMMSHPNVVGAMELAEADGRWFMAMELVRGPTVHDLAAGGRLDPAMVLDVGIQTAAGLAHIHSFAIDGHPLVHRDIKPQNLLVDPSGLVKIADLGALRLATGGIAGTPPFMAPETLEGHEEPRSDLFSLGVTLYRIATGRYPFGRPGGDQFGRAAVAARLAEPRFFAPVSHQVPGLQTVLARCLAVDPEDRWPDARSLGEALKELTAAASRHGGPDAVVVPPPAEPIEDEPTWVPQSEMATVVLPEGNLPRPSGSFVGRAAVSDAVEAQLATADLVTLRGPPGVGKTRLAIEVGHALAPAPVWFCPLSEVCDAAGLIGKVAAVLGVSADPEALAAAIAARAPFVLILDRMEPLIAAGGPIVTRWRQLGIRLLVTSQVSLGLPGEAVVAVEPLGIGAAVALFQEGASRPAPDTEGAELKALVTRLDGLPLAIELAAARTRTLRVPEILERLDHRFQLLRDDDRIDPIHRSLAASLGASWALLDEVQRRVLAQLSVFRGGFGLAAAEAVVEVPGASWVLETLDALVRRSLVQVSRDRFRLLESVAAFAQDPSGGKAPSADLEGAQVRHGRYFATFGGDEALAAVERADGVAGWGALADDLDNLVIACRRGVARRDPIVASATALAAWAVIRRQGPFVTAALLVEAALGVAPDEPRLHCASVQVATLLDQDPEPRLERALAVAQEHGDRRAEGVVSRFLGIHDQSRGDMEQAEACYRAALQLHEEDGDLDLVGVVHNCLGTLFADRGRYHRAEASYRRALELARETGDVSNEAGILSNLGNLEDKLGRHREALAHHEEALEIHRTRRDRPREALTLGNLAILQAKLGQGAVARGLFEDALGIHRSLGHRRMQGMALHNLAKLHVVEGRLDEGGRIYDQAMKLHRAVGNRRGIGASLVGMAERLDLLGDESGALAALEEALPLLVASEDRRTEGLAHLVAGQVHLRCGDLARAQGAFERALARFGRLGDLGNEISSRMYLGEVASACGRGSDAEQLLREVLADALELDDAIRCRVRVRLAGVCNARGDARGALDELGAADSDLEALLDPYELALSYVERSRALAILGNDGAADEARDAARSLARECAPANRGVVESRLPPA